LPASSGSADDPFVIMAYPPASLTGQWTVDKWEYWLREREISPAVRNLAQHGVMYGQIGGQDNQFVIAPEHRVLTLELVDGLLEALQGEWPNTKIQLEFAEPADVVPMRRKQIRRVQAEARARELIQADPVIAPLIAQLGATLVEMELREQPDESLPKPKI